MQFKSQTQVITEPEPNTKVITEPEPKKQVITGPEPNAVYQTRAKQVIKSPTKQTKKSRLNTIDHITNTRLIRSCNVSLCLRGVFLFFNMVFFVVVVLFSPYFVNPTILRTV